jgi:hypothetical protein
VHTGKESQPLGPDALLGAPETALILSFAGLGNTKFDANWIVREFTRGFGACPDQYRVLQPHWMRQSRNESRSRLKKLQKVRRVVRKSGYGRVILKEYCSFKKMSSKTVFGRPES